jgi:hypothetical protein
MALFMATALGLNNQLVFTGLKILGRIRFSWMAGSPLVKADFQIEAIFPNEV